MGEYKVELVNDYFLVNGCSFTLGQELKYTQQIYVNTLSSRLKLECFNISSQGKTNSIMYQELYAFLLNVKSGDIKKPEFVIWQTTDNYRQGIIRYRREFKDKRNIPGDVISQLSIGVNNYTYEYKKLRYWSSKKKLESYRESLIPEEQEKFDKAIGCGSVLLHFLPIHDKSTGVIKNNDFNHEQTAITDITNISYELNHISNIVSLQALCKEIDVPLAILNYYEFNPLVLKDNMIKCIDDSKFVIKNYKEKGIYNHFLWRGFDRPDGFHFDADAHAFKADIIYDFITLGKQIEVETESHEDLEDYPVFDYT